VVVFSLFLTLFFVSFDSFLTPFWVKSDPQKWPPPSKKLTPGCVCMYIYIYKASQKHPPPPDFLTGVEILWFLGSGFQISGCRVTFSYVGSLFLMPVTFSEMPFLCRAFAMLTHYNNYSISKMFLRNILLWWFVLYFNYLVTFIYFDSYANVFFSFCLSLPWPLSWRCL